MSNLLVLEISGAYIKRGGSVAGAAGAANAVTLKLCFGTDWAENIVKQICFTDAEGGNAVTKLVTLETKEAGEETYYVDIPSAPLAKAGEMTVTVRGVELSSDGETVTQVLMTASTTLTVLPSQFASDTLEVLEATQVEQLQAQIEALKATLEEGIAASAEAAVSRQSAQEDADRAEEAQLGAEDAMEDAKGYATAAAASATAAAGSAAGAASAQTGAVSSALAAQSAETAATQAAQTAQSAMTQAGASQEAAAASAAQTETDAAAAQASRAAAESAAQSAQAAAVLTGADSAAAAAACTAAEQSEITSRSWAVGGTGTREEEDRNNAKYWSECAAQAAGGGVTSFNGRGGAVSAETGDYTADMVGADPAGSADAVNAYAAAHIDSRSNPHLVTAAQVGADPAGTAQSLTDGAMQEITAHTGDSNNPHAVTAAQVGADPAGSAEEVRTEMTQLLSSIDAGQLTSGIVPVAYGGTGLSSLTSGYFLSGNGTGAMNAISPANVPLVTGSRGYGTCATAAATAAKVGTLSGFVRQTGAVVGIKFTYANTAASPTLNVNSTGAAAIYDHSTGTYPLAGAIGAGMTHLFQYNGSQWVLLNPRSGGILQSGTYTGTGTYGSGNLSSITFSYSITGRILMIIRVDAAGAKSYQGDRLIAACGVSGAAFSYYYSTAACTFTYSGNTVSWYSSDASYQMNSSGYTYYYALIG
ncbi:MAG: hypothetical protein LIO58_04155 [Oscillospiraceae bacterium]|nr:hypothetical protein [Oscillospiraceae bacterium]